MSRICTKTVNNLLLSTKSDIPFNELGVIIRQPSVKEIGMLGEREFLLACQFFSRDFKANQDKTLLKNFTNFDIFMSVVNQRKDNANVAKVYEILLNLLFLLCPNYQITFQQNCILFIEQSPKPVDNQSPKVIPHILDARNFELFNDILYQMFCLEIMGDGGNGEYNPSGIRAQAIADKLRARREKLAQLKKQRGENEESMSIFSRYQSILSVGLGLDMNTLSQYSVWQLVETFKRFELRQNFDFTFDAKLAGAKNLKDADNWMEEIQFKVKK